jgi:hypothetical protein
MSNAKLRSRSAGGTCRRDERVRMAAAFATAVLPRVTAALRLLRRIRKYAATSSGTRAKR